MAGRCSNRRAGLQQLPLLHNLIILAPFYWPYYLLACLWALFDQVTIKVHDIQCLYHPTNCRGQADNYRLLKIPIQSLNIHFFEQKISKLSKPKTCYFCQRVEHEQSDVEVLKVLKRFLQLEIYSLILSALFHLRQSLAGGGPFHPGQVQQQLHHPGGQHLPPGWPTQGSVFPSGHYGSYSRPCKYSNAFISVGMTPRFNAVMDSLLACYAEGPGLIPATSKCFFLTGISG